jgi:hypothetical protein
MNDWKAAKLPFINSLIFIHSYTIGRSTQRTNRNLNTGEEYMNYLKNKYTENTKVD